MILHIDTTQPLTEFDATVLRTLVQFDAAPKVEATVVEQTPAPAPVDAEPVKPKRTRKPKAEPAMPPVYDAEELNTPVAEPEATEPEATEPIASGATKDDAVAAATAAIQAGRSDAVRKALAAVGAPKVGQLSDDQVAGFLAALEG